VREPFLVSPAVGRAVVLEGRRAPAEDVLAGLSGQIRVKRYNGGEVKK